MNGLSAVSVAIQAVINLRLIQREFRRRPAFPPQEAGA